MEKRKIDKAAGKIYTEVGKRFTLIRKTKLTKLKAFILIAFALGSVVAIVWGFSNRLYNVSDASVSRKTDSGLVAVCELAATFNIKLVECKSSSPAIKSSKPVASVSDYCRSESEKYNKKYYPNMPKYNQVVSDSYQLDGAINKKSFILVVEENYNEDLYTQLHDWINPLMTSGRIKVTNHSEGFSTDAQCYKFMQMESFWIHMSNLKLVQDYIKDKSWMKIYMPPTDPVVNISKITSSTATINWVNMDQFGPTPVFNFIALRVGTNEDAVNSGCPKGVGLDTGCIVKDGAYLSNGVVYSKSMGVPRIITDLSPNTTYYYRVAAVAGNDYSKPYSDGTNGNFKTLAQ